MEIVPLSLWLGCLLIISIPGLLIAAWIFKPLPGRGAGFALPISLGILTLVGFWAGRIILWPWALVTGLVILVGLAVIAVRRGVSVNRQAILESSTVFFLGFIFMTYLKSLKLGVVPWTDDFLNFGLLKLLLRSHQLPPRQFMVC
jgi:uncharacterized membrane protein